METQKKEKNPKGFFFFVEYNKVYTYQTLTRAINFATKMIAESVSREIRIYHKIPLKRGGFERSLISIVLKTGSCAIYDKILWESEKHIRAKEVNLAGSSQSILSSNENS